VCTTHPPKGGYTFVTLPRIVTPYRDSVDGTRDRVTYQKLNFTSPDVFHNYHKIYTFVQHIYNLLKGSTDYMFRLSWAIIRPYI